MPDITIPKIGRLTKRVVLDGTIVAGSNPKFEGIFDASEATFDELTITNGNIVDSTLTNSTINGGFITGVAITDSSATLTALTVNGVSTFNGQSFFNAQINMGAGIDMNLFSISGIGTLQFNDSASISNAGSPGNMIFNAASIFYYPGTIVNFTDATITGMIKSFPARAVLTAINPFSPTNTPVFSQFNYRYMDKFVIIRNFGSLSGVIVLSTPVPSIQWNQFFDPAIPAAAMFIPVVQMSNACAITRVASYDGRQILNQFNEFIATAPWSLGDTVAWEEASLFMYMAVDPLNP